MKRHAWEELTDTRREAIRGWRAYRTHADPQCVRCGEQYHEGAEELPCHPR